VGKHEKDVLRYIRPSPFTEMKPNSKNITLMVIIKQKHHTLILLP